MSIEGCLCIIGHSKPLSFHLGFALVMTPIGQSVICFAISQPIVNVMYPERERKATKTTRHERPPIPPLHIRNAVSRRQWYQSHASTRKNHSHSLCVR